MKKVPVVLLILLFIFGLYYYMKTSSRHGETLTAEKPPAPVIEEKAPSSPAAGRQRTVLKENVPPASSPSLVRPKNKKRHISKRKPKPESPVQEAKKDKREQKNGPLDNVHLSYSFSSAPLFPAKVRENDASSLPDDETVALNIRLLDGEKEEKQLVVRRFWKNYRGKDGVASKTLFMTEWPNDASGTGFLICDYSDPAKSRGLWLYHPSLLGKVQEVSAGGQDDPFMGSDLTFRDLTWRHPDEDDIRILGELSCGVSNEKCYVVESVPKDKGEIYGKKILWVTERNFITMKIEYYDGDGNLLKTEIINWEDVSGHKMWKSAEVINARNQHRTVFEISNVEINTGIKDEVFTEQALKPGFRP